MPSTATYVVTRCHSSGQVKKWNACVRANIFTSEQAQEWLREFELLNSLDFRVRKAHVENSDRIREVGRRGQCASDHGGHLLGTI